MELQAPRPSTSGSSKWSGWFSYITGLPAGSPLPHSSCFELSSTTVTRRIRQVWPTPSAGMQPEAEPLRQLSCQGHNWSISGLGLGCCLGHHARPLSFHTYLPSLCVSILKIPEMLIYRRLRQGLEEGYNQPKWH